MSEFSDEKIRLMTAQFSEPGLKGYISRYSHSDYLQLKYSKYEAIVLTEFMYKNKSMYYLKRKYLKIQASLRIIGQRPGGEIGNHATFRS